MLMDEFATLVICAIVLFLILFGLDRFNVGIDDSWREQIVAHGCAEFYLDQKNVCQWRWKN